MGKDTHIVLNKVIISSNRERLMVSETSKFDWTSDNIRIQKISRFLEKHGPHFEFDSR